MSRSFSSYRSRFTFTDEEVEGARRIFCPEEYREHVRIRPRVNKISRIKMPLQRRPRGVDLMGNTR